MESIWATFGNIRATFLLQHLVTLDITYILPFGLIQILTSSAVDAVCIEKYSGALLLIRDM